jgi:hypothetical protein
MHRSEVKEEAANLIARSEINFIAAGGHERRCVRCGDGGLSYLSRKKHQSTRLNHNTESDAEITANIAANKASKPEISVSFVSVEIRELSFS